MRKVFISLLLLLFFGACQTSREVTITVIVKDSEPEQVELYLLNADTVLTLDSEGKGIVSLPVEEPQYGIIKYKWKVAQVYFEPGNDFVVNWNMSPSELTVNFEGKNMAENNFINGKELDTPRMGDFGLAEQDLLEKLDNYLKDNVKILESKGFSKDFVDKEKYRLTYNVYGMLWQYALRGKATDASYTKIKSLIVEEDWLLQLNSFVNYIQGAVECLAMRDLDYSNMSALDITMRELNYVQEHITNTKIKEHLIGVYAIDFIAQEGINQAETVKEFFENNVTDPVIIAAFNKVYEEGKALSKGMKAPEFNYPDINGKMVSLSDLKGSLVYIDIWATWCAPCQEELPHLKQMEDALKELNVSFVSISVDKDKSVWEQAVKSGDMGGIQLWAGTDNSFMNAFRVQGIPRFILIDKDGNILEANMSRPSDEKTIAYIAMYAEPKED